MPSVHIPRCRKCIMPVNYPGIRFDEQGICNFCKNPKRLEYQGAEALKEKILSYRSRVVNSRYDCALGFSGGRDSSYLLYLLSKVLHLKVLAFTIDNGNMPPETRQNIANMKNFLDADFIIEKYPYLEKCFPHHLKAWLRKPSPAMIPALCVGCRLALARGKYEILQRYGIPVYISGGAPFEGNQFKTNLLRLPRNGHGKLSLLLGYAREVMKNAQWLGSLYALMTQINEFKAFFGLKYNKKMRREGYVTISPFYKFIKWEEKTIVGTIEKELGWQKNDHTGSTWRGDCDIALLKLYLYQKLLGFNDKDDSFSDLIRDGQLSRDEALTRLTTEHQISDMAIRNLMVKNGIDYGDFRQILDNIKATFGDEGGIIRDET